jgi:hypothetical protein
MARDEAEATLSKRLTQPFARALQESGLPIPVMTLMTVHSHTSGNPDSPSYLQAVIDFFCLSFSYSWCRPLDRSFLSRDDASASLSQT